MLRSTGQNNGKQGEKLDHTTTSIHNPYLSLHKAKISKNKINTSMERTKLSNLRGL
jgi:hypothetical protein